jgi:hypothetical protein
MEMFFSLELFELLAPLMVFMFMCWENVQVHREEYETFLAIFFIRAVSHF